MAGAIVGAVCAILTFVLAGVHGIARAEVTPLAVFAFGFNLNGALVGAGFALTRARPAA